MRKQSCINSTSNTHLRLPKQDGYNGTRSNLSALFVSQRTLCLRNFFIDISPLCGIRHDLSGDFGRKKLYYSFHITNLIAYDNYHRHMEKIPLTLSSSYLIIFRGDTSYTKNRKKSISGFSVGIWQTRSGLDATPKCQKNKTTRST